MALATKDNQTCPKCGRGSGTGVRVYKTRDGWMCGKCLKRS